MDTRKQRVIIAEENGWIFSPLFEPITEEIKLDATLCWVPPNGELWHRQELPNYHKDLNAIVEVVRKLPEESRRLFSYELNYVVNPNFKVGSWTGKMVEGWWDMNEMEVFKLCTATAEQWCEAYLKTIKKWKPDNKIV